MNRRLSFIIFCLICTFLLFVCKVEADVKAIGATKGWEAYRNEKYGFGFSYPKNWKFSYNEKEELFKRYSGEFSITLQSPSEILQSTGLKYPVSIGIECFEIFRLKEGWESVALSAFEEGVVLKGPEKINFKGNPAYKGTLIIAMSGLKGYLQELFFASPDNKWFFRIIMQKTYSIEEDHFKEEDYFTEVYNKIINSFWFL